MSLVLTFCIQLICPGSKIQNLAGAAGRRDLDSDSRGGLDAATGCPDAAIGGPGAAFGGPSASRAAAAVSFTATVEITRRQLEKR